MKCAISLPWLFNHSEFCLVNFLFDMRVVYIYLLNEWSENNNNNNKKKSCPGYASQTVQG